MLLPSPRRWCGCDHDAQEATHGLLYEATLGPLVRSLDDNVWCGTYCDGLVRLTYFQCACHGRTDDFALLVSISPFVFFFPRIYVQPTPNAFLNEPLPILLSRL